MSEMFDKAVRAVEGQLEVQELLLADPITLRRLMAQRIVRDVLVSLRDEMDVKVAWLAASSASEDAAHYLGHDLLLRVWQAVIQEILGESFPVG